MTRNLFFGQDILSVDKLTIEHINLAVETAKHMRQVVEKDGACDELRGKVMTALFYEPSSRTYASFIAAMQRLGGGFIPLQGMVYSSVAKGENLPDTVRTFESYSDIIVIRHPEIGAARIAAQFSHKPVINAGDGVGEHPTQALLDILTIQDKFGKIDNLTVTLVGDLLNGRTVHSLSKLLSLYPNVKLNLVSPMILPLPRELVDLLKTRKVNVRELYSLEDAAGETDVLYMTRVQKERFTDLESYEKVKNHFIVNQDVLSLMKKDAIIMHPFPRVGEIDMEVDLDPRAVYIKGQMANGMFMRMALLYLILKKVI